MKLFSKKKSAEEAVPVPQKPELPKWGQAKLITAAEAAPGNLPIGWYFWVQGEHYYALKPNSANTGLTASSGFTSVDQLRQWIEISLPSEIPELIRPRYNLEEVLAEARTRASAQHQGKQKPPVKRTAVPNRLRGNEAHIRFTDEEFRRLQDRVAASCLPQSVFMRQAVLTGEIKADPHRDILIQEIRNLNAELRSIRGDCGKLGGLLKMTIKPNEEQKALHPDDWESLIHTVHALFSVQRVIEKTMEKINGRFSNELQ